MGFNSGFKGLNMEARKITDKEEQPIRKWEGNNKTDHKEIGREEVNWIHVSQDRGMWRADVYTVMNLQFPYNVQFFLTNLGSTVKPT